MKSPPAAVKMVMQAVCILKVRACSMRSAMHTNLHRANMQRIGMDCALPCSLCRILIASNQQRGSLFVIEELQVYVCRGHTAPTFSLLSCSCPLSFCLAACPSCSNPTCSLQGSKATRVKDPGSGQWVMDWWESSKKLMNDMSFLDSLKAYDKVRINRASITNPGFDVKLYPG